MDLDEPGQREAGAPSWLPSWAVPRAGADALRVRDFSVTVDAKEVSLGGQERLWAWGAVLTRDTQGELHPPPH